MSVSAAQGKVYAFGSFGSFESIKKQAEAIKERVGKESEARKAEQEKTGLIKNPDTGEMVELSSISDHQKDLWDNRNEMNTISPQEAYVLFAAADPHAEEVERSKALGAEYEKIQNKMLAGKKLTGKEKRFLRENYPQLATQAEQMEQEAETLKKKLQSSKSPDDAQRIYMEAKLSVMSRLDRKDGSALFLMAAIDNAYDEHNGRKSRNLALDISV